MEFGKCNTRADNESLRIELSRQIEITFSKQLAYASVAYSENYRSNVRIRDLEKCIVTQYRIHDFVREPAQKRRKTKFEDSAVNSLLSWWNDHLQFPFPTEVERGQLAETTGLSPTQVNNWFINRRKRSYKSKT